MLSTRLCIHSQSGRVILPHQAQTIILDQFPRAQRIQNLAYALLKAGIEPGDRVGVIAPNS